MLVTIKNVHSYILTQKLKSEIVLGMIVDSADMDLYADIDMFVVFYAWLI